MDSDLPHRRLNDGFDCDHFGETGTYCTKCWTNLYEMRHSVPSAVDWAASPTRPSLRGLRALKLLGIGGILLAATLAVHSEVALHRYAWTPLRVPVQMKEDTVVQSSFKAEVSESHRVELDFARALDFERLNCLLGISSRQETCQEHSILAAVWTVSSDGVRVPQRDWESSGGYWGATIGRELGSFIAERGKTYTVSVHILKDATALQPADPHLQVVVEPLYFEAVVVDSGIEQLVALILGFVGGGCLVLWRVLRHRQRLRGVDGVGGR